MSRYRKVDPRIWNDEKFRDLSDAAKLVFFMLLTHPNMTSLGAMRATSSGLAEELGWEPEAFREAFREALSKGMAEHDQKACLVAIPNFIRYNPPESPNVVKAWVGALDLLPECEMKTRVITRAVAFAKGMTKGFAEALPEAFAKGMPYQEQKQEQEQKQKDTSAQDSANVVPIKPDQQPDEASDLATLGEAHFARLVAEQHAKAFGLPRAVPVGMQLGSLVTLRAQSYAPAQSGDWWLNYFEHCAADDFLNGTKNPKFKADLVYLLDEKTFGRVIESSQKEAAHG